MDTIADMISQIRNAGAVGKKTVLVPYSKLRMSIVEALSKKGYVGAVSEKDAEPSKLIEIELLYGENGLPVIKGTERVSRPSQRVYEKAKNLRSVKYGYGDLVLSTPQGIMTDTEARSTNTGGEVLFAIW